MRNVQKALSSAGLAIIAMLAASGSAQAFEFTCVTGDGGCSTAGTSVASWSLTDGVLTISNAAGSGNGSFITGISFDLSAGQTVALSASQGPGVAYTAGGGANLPASLGWTIDQEYKPDGKPATNGIHAGESLSFDVGGVTLADIGSGAFKFGVHVQALGGGRSEKLVNVSQVPEAGSVAMILAGMAVMSGVVARRRLAR